jgi:putative nucleotidyltransferase with HDIG domain
MVHMLDTLVPCAPGWSLDWQVISDSVAEVAALRDCPQDPVHHGEGDVWIHTRMVCEALIADAQWRALPADDRRTVFWTAVLHDIGKPATTRHEDGRITSRGHSRRGENLARQLLWRLGCDILERERITALIAHHLVPFFLLERADPTRLVARISLGTRCDWLSLLARADARGRISPDVARLIDYVELFAEFARDAGCLAEPFSFASDHSRFVYFRKPDRDPRYEAYDDTEFTVTVMAGLPAAGKDTWIADHLPNLPVVSLDALRGELGVAPAKPQGAVIQAARDLARVHLRRGEAFVWNATNLSRQIRGNCIDLLADYNARVRVVHLEAPPDVLETRNRQRQSRVPDKAIARMLERWEAPDLTEAHEVEMVDLR